MRKANDLHALHNALSGLKLDQMALSLDALCQQAAKEEWTYVTFLGFFAPRLEKVYSRDCYDTDTLILEDLRHLRMISA